MRYLIVDTESSVCQMSRDRVLVSIAYEVLDVDPSAAGVGPTTLARVYDLVKVPPHYWLDATSERIHGITAYDTHEKGLPLERVLVRLAAVVKRYAPQAIVGHDVASDVVLLVSECVRAGIPPDCFGCLFRKLICTKVAALPRCRIPLPQAAARRAPQQVLLPRRPRGRTKKRTWRPVAPAQLPAPPPPQLKWPSLEESYDILVKDKTHLCGRFTMHDARGDVERCRAVFLGLNA